MAHAAELVGVSLRPATEAERAADAGGPSGGPTALPEPPSVAPRLRRPTPARHAVAGHEVVVLGTFLFRLNLSAEVLTDFTGHGMVSAPSRPGARLPLRPSLHRRSAVRLRPPFQRPRASVVIASVAIASIVFAVLLVPFTLRGETRHHHMKGEILPAGTISGQHNPEAIPELVAYGLLFRTLQSLSQDPENAKAYESYLRMMKLDSIDRDGRGSELALFRKVVDRYTTQMWQVDFEVIRLKNVWRTSGGGRRDAYIEGQIRGLEVRKESILSTITADLPRDVGIRGRRRYARSCSTEYGVTRSCI